MKLLPLGAFALGAALWAVPNAMAGSQDGVLRVAFAVGLTNVDPYYNVLGVGRIVATHAWDTLLMRDLTTGELHPALATEWTRVDDLTWEFKLREGVVFHNGDPFTAEDVAYTVNEILADNKVVARSNYSWIDKAVVVDPHTVRIHTNEPFAAALDYIAALLPIWPAKYRQELGATQFSQAPVGTGPYRITGTNSSGDIMLERFEAYYESSPKGKPQIEKISIRHVADQSAQMAQFLGGQLDWIERVPSDQFQHLARMPGVETISSEVQRVISFQFGIAGLPDDHPIAKANIRRAIAHGINRANIAAQLLPSGAQVLNAACYAEQFGCDQQNATAYPYDVEKARALLAEEGLSDGFTIEMQTYLPPTWAAAVQSDLANINIKAEVRQVQASAVVEALMKGEMTTAMGRWNGYGIADVIPYLKYWFSGTALDSVKDPALIEVVSQAGREFDQTERNNLYNKAFKIISDEVYYIPLFTEAVNYAYKNDLSFSPSVDDTPKFYSSQWK